MGYNSSMKTLKDYSKEHGIKYRAAWNRYKAGKIEGAFQDEFGAILIPDNSRREPYVVCYARVSSSENKSNLESQAERLVAFSNANGWVVKEVVKECGSGLNDSRKKLGRVLNNPVVTKIVVEHKDRLTRFGFEYLKQWMTMRGCEIIVINESTDDKTDLMQDFISLVTSFTARLYGLRRSKRNTERLIEELKNAEK
jgi:predicted site-specific integrase-resolvase